MPFDPDAYTAALTGIRNDLTGVRDDLVAISDRLTAQIAVFDAAVAAGDIPRPPDVDPPPPPPDTTWSAKEAFIRCAWSRTGPYNPNIGPPYQCGAGYNKGVPRNYDWAGGASQGNRGTHLQRAGDPIGAKLVNCWVVVAQAEGQPVVTNNVFLETRHPAIFRQTGATWNVTKADNEWSAQYPEGGMLPGSTPGGNTTGFAAGERVRLDGVRGGQRVAMSALARTGKDVVHLWWNRNGKIPVGNGCTGIAFAVQMRVVGPKSNYLGYCGMDLWSDPAHINGSLGQAANIPVTEVWQWFCFVDGSLTIARLEANPPPLPAVGSPADV